MLTPSQIQKNALIFLSNDSRLKKVISKKTKYSICGFD